MEHLQDSSMSGGGGFYLNTSAAATRNNNSNVGGGVGTKCGRWNPTAEQVKVLTELFRAGLRTPSTDQIQKISSQLSFYGKIESKNVFYWFQNHKARERQKRRRSVSADEDDAVEQLHVMVRKDEKICSARLLQERNNNQASETERAIETLQLFPVNNSFNKSQPSKTMEHFNVIGGDYDKATAKCAYKLSYELNNNEHPPLDLRLSFV
ncbi:hypothetical protein QQ045_004179 [Rhodiola kirilowii]